MSYQTKYWLVTSLCLGCLWATLAWPVAPMPYLPLGSTMAGFTQTEYGDMIRAAQLAGQLDQQMKAYEAASEKAPTNLISLYSLCLLYYQQALDSAGISETGTPLAEKISLAENALQRLQLLSPDLLMTYFKLGKLSLLQNRLEDAKAWYQSGLAIDPDNASLTFNLADVLEQQHQTDAAIKTYQKAIALDKNFVFAYNNLGLLYEKTHQYTAAEHCYLQALSLQPNYVHAHLNLGALYETIGDRVGAKMHYKTVLRLDPNNAWACFYLGGLAYKSEQYNDALIYFQQALSHNPGFSAGYYYMAITLVRLNRLDEAVNASLTYLHHDESGPFASEVKQLVDALMIHKANDSPSH